MAESGVRSSWLTFATKSERIRSRRRMRGDVADEEDRAGAAVARRGPPGRGAAASARRPNDLGVARLAPAQRAADEREHLRVADDLVDGAALDRVARPRRRAAARPRG